MRIAAYKWTLLIGASFLASILWSEVVSDGYSMLLVIFAFFGFLASTFASVVSAIGHRTNRDLYRVGINLAFVVMVVLAPKFGAIARDRLFLWRIGRFQEVTDLMVKSERAKAASDTFVVATTLPPGYSSLGVSDRVLINSTAKAVVVRYITRDSSALGHHGYMYRSDDDAAALRSEFPHIGYTHLAPHWFFFAE